jgi:hypothetical protein
MEMEIFIIFRGKLWLAFKEDNLIFVDAAIFLTKFFQALFVDFY